MTTSSTSKFSFGTGSRSLVVLVGGLVVVVVAGTTVCVIQRRKRGSNETTKTTTTTSGALRSRRRGRGRMVLPPELQEERLSRTSLYFENDNNNNSNNNNNGGGMHSIRTASVLVVGCGGVGSHAALSLARNGVGYLRLVDMDVVTLSSLNRHACATLDDVGRYKVDVLATHIHAIVGDDACTVDARRDLYDHTRSDLLEFSGKWDMVIDAIDDVTTKTSLLEQCFRRDLRVVSCMGSGGKADPTRIHMSDLNGANQDPLATKLRARLRKVSSEDFVNDADLLTVVYSSEKVVAKLADLTDEQRREGARHFGAVDGMRVRLMPVLGCMPAIMGQACAAYALCQIGEKPFAPMPGERLGRNVRHRAFQHYKNREVKIRQHWKMEEEGTSNRTLSPNPLVVADGDQRLARLWFVGGSSSNDNQTNNDNGIGIDLNDVEYLLSTVWRQKCAVTNARLGVILELVRWDMTKPGTVDNLVLMDMKSIRTFDDSYWDTHVFGPHIKRHIERRLSMVREGDSV